MDPDLRGGKESKGYAGWPSNGEADVDDGVTPLFEGVESLRGTRGGKLLKTIANANDRNGSYSGCWDVIAWTDEDVLIIESKSLATGDSLNRNQRLWFDAARGLVPLSRFLIVEWYFADWLA